MIVSHNVSLVSHLLLIIHQKKIGYVPYYGKCKVSMYKMNDIEIFGQYKSESFTAFYKQ